ncbi:putative molybdopterin binding domain-containing protein [Dimargaris cristalligena]|uniref:Putative molybdopterin binding domain-containing protein n=1 Tax=Dimargaris cristalligena TaxID=215637 RepID=A0A4P9ZU83_9FUNG|nr:putative molybdopterin binding domain-containing protein [Dimargaris cristalligena]|eukprot:RKP37156.1 putative molybdopterin binding domain-containing protein [Dimargaris cristalligena]
MDSDASAALPSIAACIIGDEILNGKIQDTNVRYLARACFQLGLTLQRVEMVADDHADIAEAVRRLAARYDHVITTGGIGPTHDDITYEALARAFGDGKLVYHQPTLDRMERISPSQQPSPRSRSINSSRGTADETSAVAAAAAHHARRRMALLPEHAQVVFPCEHLWVPIATVENVAIFPGIPALFQTMLDAWLPTLLIPSSPSPSLRPTEPTSTSTPNPPPHTRLAVRPFQRVAIATHWPESRIAAPLTELQAQVADQKIKIGSYPLWQDPRAKVVITFVGRDPERLTRCAELIKRQVEGFDWQEEEEEA